MGDVTGKMLPSHLDSQRRGGGDPTLFQISRKIPCDRQGGSVSYSHMLGMIPRALSKHRHGKFLAYVRRHSQSLSKHPRLQECLLAQARNFPCLCQETFLESCTVLGIFPEICAIPCVCVCEYTICILYIIQCIIIYINIYVCC